MLTGKRAIEVMVADRRDMRVSYIGFFIKGEYPDIRKLNPDIDEFLAYITYKALAVDINKRYQTAQEMLRDVEDWLNGRRLIKQSASTKLRPPPSVKSGRRASTGDAERGRSTKRRYRDTG